MPLVDSPGRCLEPNPREAAAFPTDIAGTWNFLPAPSFIFSRNYSGRKHSSANFVLEQDNRPDNALLKFCKKGSGRVKCLNLGDKFPTTGAIISLTGRLFRSQNCRSKQGKQEGDEGMPRANRYYIPGHVWHITHRCHKKEFLKPRGQAWLDWLFEAKKRFGIVILNYTLLPTTTSSGLWRRWLCRSSRRVSALAGRTGQGYNQRRPRGAASMPLGRTE